MKIKLLMHTQPNITSFNAQDLNGREIASRFDENFFEIYFIDTLGTPIDSKIDKTNIHILNAVTSNSLYRKFLRFKYKLLQKYAISFYIRVFKDDGYFLRLLKLFDKDRKTMHMVENRLPYPNATISYQQNAKFNALNSTCCVAISKRVAKDIQNEYGIKADFLIPVGVDTSLFKPNLNKNNKRLKILSCGTFQKRKQPELFADIAKEFSSCDFYWVGEGELKNDIQRKKEKESIENLYLLDNMQHKELSTFMADCDIFLFPSLHEGFPKVLVESMACGLPNIVFDAYEPEATINNKTGFIVSNREEMIEKLHELINNPPLRKEFSINAIQRAKKFDWNIIVKAWENTLFQILDR